MNKEQVKGQWKEIKGSIQKKWGELTDDEVSQMEGDYDKMVGSIEKKYGKSKEDAKKEVNSFLENMKMS